MKSIIKIGIVLFFLFHSLSCQKKQNCHEQGDLEFYLNTYNAIVWRPFLDNWQKNDTLLYEKLHRLSIVIGSFTVDVINNSGGYQMDKSLANPCSKIKIEEDKLNSFYNEISLTKVSHPINA